MTPRIKVARTATIRSGQICASKSMTRLKSHLEDKANKRSWDATFIAHLSLKFDGAKIVTKEMMDEKLPLIEWLLKLMGLPSTPSVVVPLTEFEKHYDASLFNANVLTTIRRGGAEEMLCRHCGCPRLRAAVECVVPCVCV